MGHTNPRHVSTSKHSWCAKRRTPHNRQERALGRPTQRIGLCAYAALTTDATHSSPNPTTLVGVVGEELKSGDSQLRMSAYTYMPDERSPKSKTLPMRNPPAGRLLPATMRARSAATMPSSSSTHGYTAKDAIRSDLKPRPW